MSIKNFIKIAVKKDAMTLAEIIIYTMVASIVLVITLKFMWNILGTGTRIYVNSELTQNGRLIFEKITADFHNAEDFLPSTVFDSNPGTLAINSAGSDPDVIFDTYTTTVVIGSTTVEIKKLRRKVGTDPAEDLTSDKVNVSTFIVKNRTRSASSKNVKIELSLENVNPGGDPSREKDLQLETSISSRIR